MASPLDLETLQAYADGELDAAEARRIEAELAHDREAAAMVERLRALSATLRAAYSEPLHSALPERVLALVRQAAPVSSASTRSPRSWIAMALAASIAAAMIAAPTSYFLADHRVEQLLARQAAERRADQAIMRSARARALESQVSGQAVDWANPDTGSRGAVTPVRTFKTSQGQWCREYRLEAEMGAERSARRAIACREADGTWADRLEILGDI